jgi:hypothetical protein
MLASVSRQLWYRVGHECDLSAAVGGDWALRPAHFLQRGSAFPGSRKQLPAYNQTVCQFFMKKIKYLISISYDFYVALLRASW